LVGAAAIFKKGLNGVGNGALVFFQLFPGVPLLLNQFHLLAKVVNDGIGRMKAVFVMLCLQAAKYKGQSRQIL